MTGRFSPLRSLSLACGLLLLSTPSLLAAGPTPAALSAFDAYIRVVESRLEQQHKSQTKFLAISPNAESRLRQGESPLEQLTPSDGVSLPGAMLHHWRGTAFVAGATAAQFEHILKDFTAYPQRFAPQVLATRVLAGQGDHLQVSMRVRQRHGITVVMDSTYDVSFAGLDAQHRYSRSQSTKIAEIDSRGTRREHELSPEEEHGFLWHQSTYWTYEERNGGLYMQIESVSLTRSIPIGLGWIVRPFVESVPRESLEFTLRSVCNALRK